jgi:hypothetical protein
LEDADEEPALFARLELKLFGLWEVATLVPIVLPRTEPLADDPVFVRFANVRLPWINA